MLIHLKRGALIFAAEILLLELILPLSGGQEWHRSVLYPLAGFLNLAAAWFLYLRHDKFLGPGQKREKESFDGSLYAPQPHKNEGPASFRESGVEHQPYGKAFAAAGLLFLIAATALYLLFGLGRRYFL